MAGYIFFIIVGYLSGSILYAYLVPKFFCNMDIRRLSEDQNPGTFNAFACAGAGIGTLVIFLELAKGFFPVFFAARFLRPQAPLFCFVLSAPVIGHAFPFLQFKKGGKAIAVSFGCLLGLYPFLTPLLYLIVFYLLFSAVVIIRPHLFRSIITFFCFTLACAWTVPVRSFVYGTFCISATVILKHLMKYKKEPFSIHFLQWNR